MILTILNSLAQQENKSLSTNTKMGLKMKMKRRELVGQASCLGYDYNKEKKRLIINEEEAKIVKLGEDGILELINKRMSGSAKLESGRERNLVLNVI